MTPTIERAGIEDLAAVTALEALCYPPERAYDPETYAAALLEPTAVNLKLVDGSRLLGFVGALVRPGRGRGHVYTLQVHPDARGMGWARRLLRAVQHELREAGVRRVRLEVAVDNVVARRLYESEGYTRRRRLPAYYGEEGADAFVYTRHLDPESSTP